MALPDMHETLEHLVAEGNRVMARGIPAYILGLHSTLLKTHKASAQLLIYFYGLNIIMVAGLLVVNQVIYSL